MFLLSGNWGEGQGAPPGAADETGRNLCQCFLSLAPGTPAPPACLCYTVAVGTLLPADTPDTVPSLGHLPPAWGQEGVNIARMGLWGRKQCPLGSGEEDKPALMGPSHRYSVQVIWPQCPEDRCCPLPLPHGAPWHPPPPAPPWPSACPRRARRAAGAGLTMHHRALCVLALGTLGKSGGGDPAGRGGGAPLGWGQ